LGIGPQSQVKLVKLGIKDYISKPFEPNELLERVGEILARPQAQPPVKH
jgi:DNA-binding response OmpR family regulator